mgnify:CR=1 FL=1
MFRLFHFIIFSVPTIFLVGCQPQIFSAYIPPKQPAPLANEIIVNQDINTLWNKFVDRIDTKKFEVYYLINKENKCRLIYNGTLEPFVDGGSLIYYTPQLFSTHQDSFPATASYASYSLRYNDKFINVERNLTSSASIYIEASAVNSNSTKILVKIDYNILEHYAEYKPTSIFFGYGGSNYISFSTHTKGLSYPSDNITVTYYPNGRLESTILELFTQ